MLARPFLSAYTLALAGLFHFDLSAARPLGNASAAATSDDGLASPLGMSLHAMSKRTTGRKTHIKNRRTFAPTTTSEAGNTTCQRNYGGRCG